MPFYYFLILPVKKDILYGANLIIAADMDLCPKNSKCI
jgi:hypothetical protein